MLHFLSVLLPRNDQPIVAGQKRFFSDEPPLPYWPLSVTEQDAMLLAGKYPAHPETREDERRRAVRQFNLISPP